VPGSEPDWPQVDACGERPAQVRQRRHDAWCTIVGLPERCSNRGKATAGDLGRERLEERIVVAVRELGDLPAANDCASRQAQVALYCGDPRHSRVGGEEIGVELSCLVG
jgi:hypothetical protein